MKPKQPHRFVLDAMADLSFTTRSMFGALAVYVGEKIVFLVRDSLKDAQANGIWIAFATEKQQSLGSEFPNMQPVHIMGKDIRGWGLLSVEAPDFEESALRACDLVTKRDPRIGKIPKSNKR